MLDIHPAVYAIYCQIVQESVFALSRGQDGNYQWAEEDLIDTAEELIKNLSELVPVYKLPTASQLSQDFLKHEKTGENNDKVY